METTPSTSGNPKSGVNVTAIIIAAIVCATLLGAVYLLQAKSEAGTGPSIVAAKPELPVFITWRETKLPGQTQVARIWVKPEAQLPLRVIVQVESSVDGDKKIKEIVLEKDNIEEPFELGVLQGHQFVPGDKLSVGHRDYAYVTSACKSLK
jgi:hypothetical protein